MKLLLPGPWHLHVLHPDFGLWQHWQFMEKPHLAENTATGSNMEISPEIGNREHHDLSVGTDICKINWHSEHPLEVVTPDNTLGQ
jgi:hypothetical protein